MDGSLTQAQGDAVGYAARRAASDIARHIDAGTRAEDGPYGWALLYVLHRTLTTFLYKAHLLDALVRRRSAGGVEVWTVGWPEASPVRGFSLMPSRFDTLFTVLGKELGLARIDLQAPEPNGAMGHGDYMLTSRWTRRVTCIKAPATD